jgi:hydroxymethylbilane synthase
MSPAASDPEASREARQVLRLGTRGSKLALTQSGTVADALRSLGAEVELVTVRTAGDQRPPDTAWGEGAFVGALETALLSGEVDLAVHSAKDVPTTEDPRLSIAAYPRREDPRDALVAGPGVTLETLPAGARIGTDSPRRSAFLRARRPDLRPHPLHGNVDTRLRRLDEGETDALILAVAGLTRLGLEGRISQILPADAVPPAPGQGALAVQCRADDEATLSWLRRIDHSPTRAAVETERAFLRASGGGCRAPIGGLARVESGEVVLVAGTAGVDAPSAGESGVPSVAWGETRGPIGERIVLAGALAAHLADELASLSAAGPPRARRPGAPPRALVTRSAAQAGPLVLALMERGIDAIGVPTIESRAVAAAGALDRAVAGLAGYDWTVVTSPNGAQAAAAALARTGADPRASAWVAVGEATAAALTVSGIPVAFTPERANGEAIAAELDVRPGARVLLARADIADARLPDALRARGAVVDEVVAYHTVEAPESSRAALHAAFAEGPFDAIVFTSGSTVRGLLALLTPQERRVALRSVACCIGPSTARVARESGFGHVVEAASQSGAALADLVASVVAGPAPADPPADASTSSPATVADTVAATATAATATAATATAAVATTAAATMTGAVPRKGAP